MIDWVQMGGKDINEFRIAVVSIQQPTTPKPPPRPIPPIGHCGLPLFWEKARFDGSATFKLNCKAITSEKCWKAKRMLATYMRRMRNNNLEIRFMGCFCRPQLNNISTCLWQSYDLEKELLKTVYLLPSPLILRLRTWNEQWFSKSL